MSEPFIGQISMFGFAWAPRDWALCSGALLPINQNQALFALIGATYGGDGRNSMGLPDLRGRAPISFGQGHGLRNWQIGDRYGTETNTLTPNQLPSAMVTLKATTEEGDSATPSEGAFLAQTKAGPAAPDQPEKIYKTNPSPSSLVKLNGASFIGNSNSVNNMSPVLAVNFCMAVEGIFPSRN